MSWLKLDDTFPQHPKLLALPRPDRWTWVEILAYCARHRDENGELPAAITEVVPKATKSFMTRCVDAGLIDVNGDGIYHVHGWNIYNGETVEDKVRAYLSQHPDATANEICRKVGGNRQDVLRAIDRLREGGS